MSAANAHMVWWMMLTLNLLFQRREYTLQAHQHRNAKHSPPARTAEKMARCCLVPSKVLLKHSISIPENLPHFRMLLGQDNRIDHMNDPVAANDVSFYHVCGIHCDTAVVSGDLEGLPIHGFC